MLGPEFKGKTVENWPSLPDCKAASFETLEIMTEIFGPVLPEMIRLGSETKISSSGELISKNRLIGSFVTGLYSVIAAWNLSG